ncbi:MAG: hypothetical protein ACJAT2_000588 [Bacteriovoracaceae bacterium]|jgi:hypothetical protein
MAGKSGKMIEKPTKSKNKVKKMILREVTAWGDNGAVSPGFVVLVIIVLVLNL